jgi:hypothetical protein
MAPPQPRKSFLGLFFVEQESPPLASPQLPAATFPRTYCIQGEQYPKPYPNYAAPHMSDFTAPVATHWKKKPCFLTVWIQKLKTCGNCKGCQHGHAEPCCAGCTCKRATPKAATASPQANLASTQGNSGAQPAANLSLQMAPPGSTWTQSGNVTEEGKLFERVSFDRFNETPQR